MIKCLRSVFLKQRSNSVNATVSRYWVGQQPATIQARYDDHALSSQIHV